MEVLTHFLASQDAESELVTWLKGSKQPLGIYLSTDDRATWLRSILLRGHVRLPGNLAVIGSGNLPTACLAERPHLSSVSYPWTMIGEATAHWAHRVFQGDPDPEPMVLRPYRVANRASTPQAALSDPMVSEGMRWLQKNLKANRPLFNLAQTIGCTPETLCRRFKKAIGQTPQKVHNAMRLQAALPLLEDPSLTITTIAKRIGFSSPLTFGVAFKRRFNCSPSQWRNESATTQDS